jgi:hypothetical protein
MAGASPIFRILLIVGWALGIGGLITDVSALAIPGGVLAALSGGVMFAGGGPVRAMSQGIHRFMGAVMVLIGLIWIVYGIA